MVRADGGRSGLPSCRRETRGRHVGDPVDGQVDGRVDGRVGKPVRDLHDTIVKRHGKLYFQGRVDPGHGPVVVQEKECAKAHCRWKKYRQVKTHGDRGRWSVRVFAPRHGNWYWRGYVRAYGPYATSWTHVWKTYVTHL